MNRKELMALFNNPTRLGTLATADSSGKVDNAVFSALQMVDENTVMMAIGDNRSYANLRENPRAAFVFFHPAPDPYAWQGGRVYMSVVKADESGPVFDQMVGTVRQMAGDRAADNIKAVLTFAIDEVRPLIDSGK
ncbi:pyridoxamine 5'-phosphate oxidase [Geothermobacter ehrlichii]|uniref:Pyridoxamine 5'-phosphate oxidase n=1 Tax=Geothermobacter ehrlichii TaxID=213224 RepID=A0A5D3WHW6_9BACT|nr:pyridoxamine 5'-phosphate oxidase family protein [Geothermobacter ehrlichii]TYO96829.1 pyridoxamine 5'-phosphate oxidase [Geothermobacter ehrlichii]